MANKGRADGLGRLHNHSSHPDGACRRCPSLPDLSPFSPQPLSLATASWRCRWQTPRTRCGSTCSCSPARGMGCSSWLPASPTTSCSSCKLATCRSASRHPDPLPALGSLCHGFIQCKDEGAARLPGPLRGNAKSTRGERTQSWKIWLNTEKQAPSGEAPHPLPG